MMKDFVKYAAVGAVAGVTGYLVGFYEMKYKVLKAMTEGFIEANQKHDSKEENIEEAQS